MDEMTTDGWNSEGLKKWNLEGGGSDFKLRTRNTYFTLLRQVESRHVLSKIYKYTKIAIN